ncbi:hypothetical protein TNCV_3559591 [Trichonephila clavipes]|uniref:Uncharacterized protein n=1 Tax=Trichonephila clavipes TaxID=2585209 RepID=A0A8X6WDY9_TRICX|nr:hypothetical protein TNCV_3559591 [Trichonephila clavipes]
MVWGNFIFDSQTPVVVIRGNLQHSGVAMNFPTACQRLPWPARFLPNRACLGYDGRATVATKFEQIWRGIRRNTLYHSMSRRIAAYIHTRVGSTPY